MPAADEAAQAAEADVHVKLAEFGDFGMAALEQGRSQFSEGTAEREIIDAIPLENNTGGGGTAVTLPEVLSFNPGEEVTLVLVAGNAAGESAPRDPVTAAAG